MVDTQKFIREVKQRPGLYDTDLKEYTNRALKAGYWIEIAQVLFKDWNSIRKAQRTERVNNLIKKWKAMRGNFARDARFAALHDAGLPCKKKKRYIYYHELKFLEAHLRKRKRRSDSEEVQDDCAAANGEAEVKEQAAAASTTTDEANNRRKIKERHSNIPQSRSPTPDLEVDMYGHKSFLLSFVPILNSLPLPKSMQVRMQITHIMNEMFSNTTEPITPLRMLKMEMSE